MMEPNSFFFSSHLRERDKMLLRGILCGEAWNGFPLENPKRMMFLAVSVVGLMEMVIFSGTVLFPSFFRIREHPECSST